MEQRLLQDEIQDREGKRLCRWFESRLDARAVVRRFYGSCMEQKTMEFCTPELGHHSLSTLDIPKIRERCIEACLEAFVEERQFKYTDAYIVGVKK